MRITLLHECDYFQSLCIKSLLQSYFCDFLQGMVYAVGSDGLAAFPVNRCTSYVMCQDCIGAKDPYCVWNSSGCMQRTSTVDTDVTTLDQCPAGGYSLV